MSMTGCVLKQALRPLCLLLAVWLPQPLLAEAPAKSLWHQSIQEGYQRLADTTLALAESTDQYCRAPDTAGRAQAEDHWRSAFEAWQAVRWVDFGPVERNNRAWQFQFWPDPKNLVGRKARVLLQSAGADLDEAVARGGVAVQGFPMAEYLLFDQRFNGSAQALPARPACQVLRAVTRFTASNAAALRNDWQAFAPHYLSEAAYTDTTIRAAMAALDILVERRVAGPMGLRGNGKRSVYAADAWRSGHSLAAIRASVAGLQSQFLPGLSQQLDRAGKPALAKDIGAGFADTLARLETLPDAMGPSLEGEGFAELQGLYIDLSQLQQAVNRKAAAALGVVRGFNSSDGD
jgi:predicted lipoprotein